LIAGIEFLLEVENLYVPMKDKEEVIVISI
jgi:hypothetical protein